MNETVRYKHKREDLAYLRQREAETGALKAMVARDLPPYEGEEVFGERPKRQNPARR